MCILMGSVVPFDKSRHARPDDNDEVGDKTRQMRAKIQGHSPILMTPFISLYEAGDITKDRRPPTIHFPAGVCSGVCQKEKTSNVLRLYFSFYVYFL